MTFCLILYNKCHFGRNACLFKGKDWSLAWLFWLLPSFCCGQDTLRWQVEVPYRAYQAAADGLGHVYLLTDSRVCEVLKFDMAGQLLYRYSNNRLGRASWIDVSDPLRLLIWYGDFRTAVFLDRTANVLATLNMSDAGFPEVRSVGTARDGRLWAYDALTFRLLKLGNEGEIVQESAPLNLLTDAPAHPGRLEEWNNAVYLQDSLEGIFLFDAFGQFRDRISPGSGAGQAIVWQGRMFTLTGGRIEARDLGSPEIRHQPLPPVEDAADVPVYVLSRQVLFGFFRDRVRICTVDGLRAPGGR